MIFCLDNGAPPGWLPPPPSTYLPNELTPFTDGNAACLPSMSSFRAQPPSTYPTNGNEPTGETLGKALQSVRVFFPSVFFLESNDSFVFFLSKDLSNWTFVFVTNNSNACLSTSIGNVSSMDSSTLSKSITSIGKLCLRIIKKKPIVSIFIFSHLD